MFCSHTQKGVIPSGCVYICVCIHIHVYAYIWMCVSVYTCMYVCVVYKALLDNTVTVYVCMCVCVHMYVPMYVWSDSSPALGTYSGLFAISSCATFEGDLTLPCVSPGAGTTASSVVSPTCGLLCTGLDTRWGVGRAPTSAHI